MILPQEGIFSRSFCPYPFQCGAHIPYLSGYSCKLSWDIFSHSHLDVIFFSRAAFYGKKQFFYEVLIIFT